MARSSGAFVRLLDERDVAPIHGEESRFVFNSFFGIFFQLSGHLILARTGPGLKLDVISCIDIDHFVLGDVFSDNRQHLLVPLRFQIKGAIRDERCHFGLPFYELVEVLGG